MPDQDPKTGRWLPGNKHAYPPGESGNPKGRPKNAGRSIVEGINDINHEEMTREQIEELANGKGKNPTPARVVAAKRWLDAMEQKAIDATKLMIDYSDGKPRQHIEVADVTPDDEARVLANLKDIREKAGLPPMSEAEMQSLIEAEKEAQSDD